MKNLKTGLLLGCSLILGGCLETDEDSFSNQRGIVCSPEQIDMAIQTVASDYTSSAVAIGCSEGGFLDGNLIKEGSDYTVSAGSERLYHIGRNYIDTVAQYDFLLTDIENWSYSANDADESTSNPYKLIEVSDTKAYLIRYNKSKVWIVNPSALNAEDFKIDRCKDLNNQDWKTYIPAKDEVLIGGLVFLNDWEIRSEISNALGKIFIKNINTNKEEEVEFTDEKVIVPGVSLIQRARNTNQVYLGYSSPKTQARTYLYNLKTKDKKLVKEQEIPSGHNPEDYIVERLECKSHDGRMVPITITRHKKTKIDGSANLLLYGYGSYGNSISPSFSSTRLSLINRDIIWVTAHIRGGMERGMKWWKEGKLLNKKNTFEDYIAVAKYLIEKKYTSKGKIIGLGGSAGGLLMGAVVNKAPELFLGIIMAVPFVDSLTTNLDHSLPLTLGEFDEFGNAKANKEHFDYIYSYAPYHNIKKMDYPHILITTSLSDNRVLFDEPAKFTAKLRDYKTDNNLLLLKTEMSAGHGGKSGRDGAIEEIALDYSFALKITGKI